MDAKIVKKTQDTLGKIIKKPPLSDKLLNKPPFRFLHDVITGVIKTTGFGKGLYGENELNSANVTEKDQKVAFLQKMIDLVGHVNGKSLSVRPSKVVAGHEPEKTNEFLQALAAAVNKKGDFKDAIQKIKNGEKLSKSSKEDKKKDKSSKSEEKGGKGDEGEEKKRRKEDKGKDREKSKDRREKDRDKGDKEKDKERSRDRDSSKDRRHKEKRDGSASGEKGDRTSASADKERKRRKEKKEKEEEAEKEAMVNGDTEEQEDHPSRPPRPTSAKGSRRRHREEEEQEHRRHREREEKKGREKRDKPVSNGINEADIPPQVAANRRLARPSSARPAPPRVKKNETEAEPPMVIGNGNVPNVIVDNKNEDSDDEADGFIAKEEEAPPLLDEPPPNLNDDNEEDGDHGGLVKNILKSKKELEGGNQQQAPRHTEIERSGVTEATRRKERQMVQKDIDRLRGSIQTLTRSANPLGKIMDYIQEDLDQMQKENEVWKKEHHDNTLALKQEQMATEKSIEPLKAALAELDQAINDQVDVMAAIKSNIIRNDDRIEKMLSTVTKS